MADNWQLKAVLSAVDNMSPALKQIALTAKTTRKYLADVGSALGNLSSKIGLPLGLVTAALSGFSLMAIKNAVVSFTELGESLYKSSLRTGMSVEQLQRMKYVAEQAGVPIEALEGGVGKLNKNIGMAAGGKSKDLSALFKKLGINTRDANGELRGAVDLLPELSDAFVRNKNPVVQARLGMALFGKSWQEMIPLLMEGSDGIGTSLERFKMLKGVMSLEDLKGAKDFGDQIKDVEYVTKGFSNTIAKELVPLLRPLVEDFIQWAAANRKVVASGVKAFAKDFIVTLKTVDWKSMVDNVKGFFGSLGSLIDMLGGTRNALIALVIVMNAQTIVATWGLIAALGKLGIAFVAVGAKAAVASTAMLSSMVGAVGGLAGVILAFAGSAVLLAAAGAVGYAIGSAINLGINKVVQIATGDKNATGGGALYEWMHKDEMANLNKPISQEEIAAARGDRPSLVGGNQVRASGKIEVSFKDMPPGTRVEQVQSGGDIPLDVNAGYREYVYD